MSEQEPEAASEGCIGHDGECCVNRENDLRDAARYRFIREAACDAAKLEALNKENKDPQTREEFDTAVDQAMSKFPNGRNEAPAAPLAAGRLDSPEVQAGEWPAGQEWHELGHTSQHTFMRRATAEAGIPHEEYRKLIETAALLDDEEALDSIWEEFERPNVK